MNINKLGLEGVRTRREGQAKGNSRSDGVTVEEDLSNDRDAEERLSFQSGIDTHMMKYIQYNNEVIILFILKYVDLQSGTHIKYSYSNIVKIQHQQKGKNDLYGD
ncbi:Hypothetical_protein [Hexamita inflata]|uniref:Hypothetical_protein n=1 Tax=Hexamita inflata TaxID=28002 RepID=A0ABP1H941_9EUKA